MNSNSQSSLFSRLTLLAMALLISNIAALSCALAFSICSECPAPERTHCVDMYDVADAVSADKGQEGTADPRTPVAGPIATPTKTSASLANHAGAGHRGGRYNFHSPPINLLNCVFLI
jgi:hypothetical protein